MNCTDALPNMTSPLSPKFLPAVGVAGMTALLWEDSSQPPQRVLGGLVTCEDKKRENPQEDAWWSCTCTAERRGQGVTLHSPIRT